MRKIIGVTVSILITAVLITTVVFSVSARDPWMHGGNEGGVWGGIGDPYRDQWMFQGGGENRPDLMDNWKDPFLVGQGNNDLPANNLLNDLLNNMLDNFTPDEFAELGGDIFAGLGDLIGLLAPGAKLPSGINPPPKNALDALSDVLGDALTEALSDLLGDFFGDLFRAVGEDLARGVYHHASNIMGFNNRRNSHNENW
jgi:hypothetical protein